MSLFSRQLYAVNESYGSIDDAANEVVTESDVFDAMLECNDNLNRINSALQITDVMMEAGLTPVTEANVKATLKTAKDKAVKFFKDLWAKIKAWFQNAWATLKTLLTGQKKFASKYGAAIKKKAQNMKTKTIAKYVDYSEASDVSKFEGFANAVKNAAAKMVKESGSKDLSKNDVTEEIIKAGAGQLGLGGTASMSEIKNKLHDKHVQTKTNFTIDSKHITQMLGYLEDGANAGDAVNKLFGATNQTFGEAIKDVQSAENATEITYTNKSFNTAISAIQGIASYCVDIITSRNTYAYRFLKQFLLNKSYNGENTPNMAGLTAKDLKESAFDTIFDTL